MNRSFMQGVKAVKEAVKYDAESRVEEAIDKYSEAVVHFQRVLGSVVNDENQTELKAQAQTEVDFYTDRIDSLKKMLPTSNATKGIENVPHGDTKRSKLMKEMTNYEDVEMRNRIKSTMLIEKPQVKFADVCGLDSLKQDLLQAAFLPLKQPQLFSTNVRPYKGFLLFGVSENINMKCLVFLIECQFSRQVLGKHLLPKHLQERCRGRIFSRYLLETYFRNMSVTPNHIYAICSK